MESEVKRNAQKVLMACTNQYDPVQLLETLYAKMGYNAGYVIRLSDSDRKAISNTIRFHKGQ